MFFIIMENFDVIFSGVKLYLIDWYRKAYFSIENKIGRDPLDQ